MSEMPEVGEVWEFNCLDPFKRTKYDILEVQEQHVQFVEQGYSVSQSMPIHAFIQDHAKVELQ